MKERILRNIQIARELGYAIKPGVWVYEDELCCPLGACLVAESKLDFGNFLNDQIALLLGLSLPEVHAFADGFDAGTRHHSLQGPGPQAAFELGREFRAICEIDT